MSILSIVAATFLISWGLAHLVRVTAVRVRLFDMPNERSSHALPIPRLGGIAIAVSVLVGAILGMTVGSSDDRTMWIWTGSAAAGAVGLMDDLYGLRPAAKLLGQMIVAGSAVYYAAPALEMSVGWACLALFTIVAFTNVFNFMDGSDGLAAGVAVLFAIGLGALTAMGDTSVILIAGLTAAGAAGFLVLNWSRASLFMGDTGSLFLGFLLSALAWRVIAGSVPLLAVGLIFLPFVGDATWTLLLRLRRRERVWEAHRSHMYQRLLITGWSHQSVASLYYAWAIVAIGFAALYINGDGAVRSIVLLSAPATVVAMELFVSSRETNPAELRSARENGHAADSRSLGI